MERRLAIILVLSCTAWAQDTVGSRSQRYFGDLLRIDSTNPPGRETAVAEYLKSVVESEGIACELLGPDPARLNFLARLPAATGEHARPLLLMAHSDVVPAEAAQWTIPPFSGALHDGFYYGRGALDDKSLLAAELAVLVELKRAGRALGRDVILMSEADEEVGSTGIQWLIRNAWKKIDAEFALNEGGYAMDLPSGTRIYQIQTAEKVPSAVVVRARGTAGHGSLPRPDNPVVRLARALVRLTEADQPVRLNPTTRQFLKQVSKVEEFAWIAPLIPRLERPQTATAVANEIRTRDPELDTQLRTTISPDIVHAGSVVNVIPAVAEAMVDVRRLPNETREEVLARLRKTVHDNQIEVAFAGSHDLPATEPSPLSTELYRVMEKVLTASAPRALVVPYMQRGATDGAFLRQKGMAVYGVPLFLREDRENRAHGADERMSPEKLGAGTELLWKIVTGITSR